MGRGQIPRLLGAGHFVKKLLERPEARQVKSGPLSACPALGGHFGSHWGDEWFEVDSHEAPNHYPKNIPGRLLLSLAGK